ncbi:restriction endonuclease subunit S [Rhodococcus fascians]|nr:restriction endonuclease subunit S [Rhodococcus fascians]
MTAWIAAPIGSVCSTYSGGTPSTANSEYYSGKIPWIASAELNQGRITSTKRRISQLALERSSAKTVEPGTPLIALYGATAGVSAITSIGGAINQAVLAMVPRDVDAEFLYQWLRANRDEIIERYTQGGQPNLSGGIVRSIEIPLPSMSEQRRVAHTLRDADYLIESLNRLLVKKQAIKQGMMQQLLTGRTRLPGFTGAWERLSVASRSVMKARIGWQGLKADEYRASGTFRLVGGTEFVDGRIDWSKTSFVDKWRYDQDTYIQLHPGDVLLTKDGTIGKTAFVDSLPGPATLNSGVFVIRPIQAAYEPTFLFWLLRSRVFEQFLARLSAGSTISHLYQRDLVTLVLDVPPTVHEQKTIAGALEDAEGEVAALQERLAKAQAIKTGMMQHLLTGRTRLPLETE